MKKIADFILSGYGQAVFFIATLAWLAGFIPLVGILSSAALALVVLRWGAQRAAIVLVLSTVLLLSLFSLTSLAELHGSNYTMMFLFVSLQWLPIIGLAYLLRQTTSLSFTLNAVTILGILLLVSGALLVPERTELWDRFFSSLMKEALPEQETGQSAFGEEYRMLLEVMTGIVMTLLITMWTAALLLARWWENLLGTPGSFRTEFTGLKLGKSMAILGIVFFIIIALTESFLVRELLMVVAYALFLQGIATAHYLLGTLHSANAWLFAFYSALLLSPFLYQIPSLLSMLGAIENLVHFRSRMHPKAGN